MDKAGSDIAVFLDRDGTLNVDPGYLDDPDKLELYDGAIEAVKLLNGLGVRVIIVTNQSGVARGLLTDDRAREINLRLIEIIKEGGGDIDGVYHCPHHPDDGCGCRKPRPGMIETAEVEHKVDPARSFVVGDKAADLGLAKNVGAKSVLVLTGNGKKTSIDGEIEADFIAKDILEAAKWIAAVVDK